MTAKDAYNITKQNRKLITETNELNKILDKIKRKALKGKNSMTVNIKNKETIKLLKNLGYSCYVCETSRKGTLIIWDQEWTLKWLFTI